MIRAAAYFNLIQIKTSCSGNTFAKLTSHSMSLFRCRIAGAVRQRDDPSELIDLVGPSRQGVALITGVIVCTRGSNICVKIRV